MSLSKSKPSIRASAWRLSCTCPGVRMKRSGSPSASTTALILVEGPPRERPIASSSVPPFCARRMLVGAHDGSVDDEIFVVRIITQRIEDTLPYAILCPSSEALEDAVPRAEFLRQIAPWRTGTIDPQYAFNKQPIVRTASSFVAFLTRTKLLDALPLRIRQTSSPNQARLLPVASLNHNCESVGIP